jgi:hypothetical protein
MGKSTLSFSFLVQIPPTIRTLAQTAVIATTSFANSFANALQIMVQQPDPANSFALSISQGQVFASNAYLYVAVAKNVTQRVALSGF